jgi:hypothetical protein
LYNDAKGAGREAKATGNQVSPLFAYIGFTHITVKQGDIGYGKF